MASSIDSRRASDYVEKAWEEDILPALESFLRIPVFAQSGSKAGDLAGMRMKDSRAGRMSSSHAFST